MAVATTGQSRASFDLKSATLPLIAVVLKTADLAEIAASLEQRLGETPDFFSFDPVVVDVSLLPPDDADRLDFAALVQVLRRYRTLPVAVRGATETQRTAARAAGLADGTDAAETAPRPTEVVREVQVEVVREVVREVEVPVEVPAAALATVVVDKPLRSGQQVYARGADLVVLAVVNVGAEVIADGNIHVYAPLRGRALAGARGNTEARIFSTSLEAQLVSIAGIYRTSETPLPPEVAGKPAQVRLDGEKILFEPL